MAGSLTYRSYTSDANIAYAIKVDESNANAAVTGGAGGALCPIRTSNLMPLPGGLQKRYVLCYNKANPSERRKFYVGALNAIGNVLTPGATITAEDYPGTNDTPGSNVTWVVTAYRGEKVRMVPSFDSPDTGLTDGTVSQ